MRVSKDGEKDVAIGCFILIMIVATGLMLLFG